MNKFKTFRITAAVLILILGIIRGVGCITLFSGAASAEIANVLQSNVLTAGICLAIVAILLIVSSIFLLYRKNRFAYTLSFVSIALFLILGLTNSFLLFGKPFLTDQLVWWSIAIVIIVLLTMSKKTDFRKK